MALINIKVVIFLLISWCNIPFVLSSESEIPIVLIISFDGFRYDYLNKTETPHFDSLISDGVTAPWIEPRFITKTLPNHYSIATGLYEESHGIVANNFYDPLLNDTFNMGSTDSKWWNEAVPLWITNELAGNNRFSGGAMWPGTDAIIRNNISTHVLGYNKSVTWFERVDTVIGWMADPVQPANCVYLYFEDPDSTGHQYGPESPEVEKAIGRADNITGYLVDQLKAKDLFNRVNIIITSDHGMTSTPLNQYTDINKYISQSTYQSFSSSPVVHILPKLGSEDEVYDALLNASKSNHFTVYKKNDIPDEYHYKNNRRIMPILLVADEHWAVDSLPKYDTKGNHGYNNSIPSMRPFFVAHGPAFKKGFMAEPFRNIDIYPLTCYLLAVEPLPNNGSLDNVRQLLISPPMDNIDQTVLIVVAVVLSACVIGAVFAIATIYKKYKRGTELENAVEEEESLMRPSVRNDA